LVLHLNWHDHQVPSRSRDHNSISSKSRHAHLRSVTIGARHLLGPTAMGLSDLISHHRLPRWQMSDFLVDQDHNHQKPLEIGSRIQTMVHRPHLCRHHPRDLLLVKDLLMVVHLLQRFDRSILSVQPQQDQLIHLLLSIMRIHRLHRRSKAVLVCLQQLLQPLSRLNVSARWRTARPRLMVRNATANGKMSQP
jgi:hypothetical protein